MFRFAHDEALQKDFCSRHGYGVYRKKFDSAVMENRNAISCASIIFHLQFIPPETFLSLDFVGVDLGEKLGIFNYYRRIVINVQEKVCHCCKLGHFALALLFDLSSFFHFKRSLSSDILFLA